MKFLSHPIKPSNSKQTMIRLRKEEYYIGKNKEIKYRLIKITCVCVVLTTLGYNVEFPTFAQNSKVGFHKPISSTDQ